jgi:hypothetical protein
MDSQRDEERELSVYRIAKQQNIIPQWVRKIYNKYNDRDLYKPNVIVFKKPGRKSKEITKEETEIVRRVYDENHGLGAVNIERILRNEGIKIPHNRIHKILIKKGLAKEQCKKKKQRKW